MSSKSTSGKKMYPVIHCIDPMEKGGVGHALANTKIACENGADGVFLIGHRLPATYLRYIYEQVRKQHPDFWIGINFLDINPRDHPTAFDAILRTLVGVNAVWTDHMPAQKIELAGIKVFGGVAFKYINPNLSGEELRAACEYARDRVDVIATSGNETGHAPNKKKLAEMRGYLGEEAKLAIFSGVTAENVGGMNPFVDIFGVASSITERDPDRGNEEYLVPEKVRELADIIHA